MIDVSSYLVYGRNGRSNALLYTDKLEEVYEKVTKGWSKEYVDGCYRLRAPEAWLVDIVEPRKVLYYGNPTINLAYYLFLSHLINTKSLSQYIDSVMKKRWIYYSGFSYAISMGAVLESDYRIIGSDYRVQNLKNDLFLEFSKNCYQSEFYHEALTIIPYEGKNATRSLLMYRQKEDLPESIKRYYENLQEVFDVIGCGDVYNPTIIRGLSDSLPEFDVMLFIPTGCFRYLSSFVNETNFNKIAFLEWHADKDLRHGIHYNITSFKGKRVLVIDKSYSGKTLVEVASHIRELGGLPTTLAVFPKNHYAISMSDYAVMLNKVYKIPDGGIGKNWAIKKYKDIFRTKEIISCKR